MKKVEQHIYPVDDIKEHVLGEDDSCWCKPSVMDEDDLCPLITAVHHSADGRELAESKYLQ